MEYKDTLNLPRTDFAMKADLITREPERLKKWETTKLYEKIQAARKDAEKFVLHDGPPFANGDVHIGTALNKILKDIIIKYQTLRGKSAPYIPGWDCHGLPIEFKVSQEMRKAGNTDADAATIRKACEAYARKYIDLQRTQFKRLGVLGDWENPYLTLNKEYEADELRLFADIVAKNFVYRGKKPVYWSIPCRTALAEAEVEYADHVSQSVFVKFPLVAGTNIREWTNSLNGKTETATITVPENSFVVIWTTTPWTLPANLAVALNATLEYVAVQVGDEIYFIADSLLNAVAEKCGWKNFHIVQKFLGWHLLGRKYQHPFINRTGGILAGDWFVESTTGTGFVHIAPGHGQDDYILGNGKLPIYSPVDDDGKLTLTNDLPREQQMPDELVGKSILAKVGKSDANEAVLALLIQKNALLHQENYHHSYPHCWRSKTPVIFRAMDQWFIKIDHNKFREQAVAEIDRVNWIPDWGVNRIKGAVQSRPDWCISRQRTWGVPIPAFYDAQGKEILDRDVIYNVAKLIEQHGSNIWFEQSAIELWKQVRPENWNRSEAVAKSNDTLDVWIDSGSSSRAVIARREEIRGKEKAFQADMYLEGSDQHRGWFQSSLLLSLAGNGAAPYKTVLTHGFMVDADREKISKSKQGAYEKPQTAEAYVKKYGADVVRLWVASQDFRSDIVVSEERINKVGETYRGIRNALRYQLSNLYDFDPTKNSVADEKLTGLDRWILGEFSDLEADVKIAYDNYEFHVVYQKLSQFIAVDLSALYHDTVKDRLYTLAANHIKRRSTQTALYRLVVGLCKMLSPILAFTSDEVWEVIPGNEMKSVHESTWHPQNFLAPESEKEDWMMLLALRQDILTELEKARQAKQIGKSLDAKATCPVSSDKMQRVIRLKEDLREFANLSQLELTADGGSKAIPTIIHADGQKCERCWHWEMDIGTNVDHLTICGRCVEAVKHLQK